MDGRHGQHSKNCQTAGCFLGFKTKIIGLEEEGTIASIRVNPGFWIEPSHLHVLYEYLKVRAVKIFILAERTTCADCHFPNLWAGSRCLHANMHCATAAALVLTLCVITAASPTVKTADGVVNGRAEGDSRSFLGIPYAKAPLDQLRWEPPVQNDPWTETLDATSFGASCVVPSDPFTSEDCLFVNVFSPATAGPKANLPVMVGSTT